MNRIHRVVFNQALSSWQAVSETAKGRTRSASRGAQPAVLHLLRAGGVALAMGAIAGVALAADGGAGGDPYPGPSAQTNTAGSGGATGAGGGGGVSDAQFGSFGGAGGNASLAGTGGNGQDANGGSYTNDPAEIGIGGAGGTGGAPSGATAGTNGGADIGDGYGGGGGAGGSNVVAAGSTTTVTGTAAGGNGGNGGQGNWAAGGGGGGGYGLVVPGNGASIVNVTGSIIGGAGGAGADSTGQAGGGGGGGDALYFTGNGSASVTNAGAITGGAGGNGGTLFAPVYVNGPSGGGGGGGGNGVTLLGGSLTNQAGGTITGGAGGAGGVNAAGDPTNGFPDGIPGGGGTGGDGVNATITGVQIFNAGTIAGGNGGAGGASVVTGVPDGAAGAGGVGVRIAGDGNTLVNAGAIAGGLAGDGVTRADAVSITGNNNTLELNAGYGFTGNVVSAGTGNTLRLGGTTDASFDVSGIGPIYQGFSGYSKVNTSTWTLTGTTAAITPWTVSGGALSISSDAALGDVSGGLTLDGGTLQTTLDIATSRAVTLDPAGGTFAPAAGTTLGLSGVVSGGGSLTTSGAGTVALTGTNTYSGSTTIGAGSTLQVGNGGATGSIDSTSGIVNNGTLVADRTGVLTLAAPISGTGALIQAGAGTTVLTGNNNYSGTTTISAGTLQVGNGGTSGTLGTGDVTNNAALSFNRSDSITVANAIGGTGTLTQAGTGTLTLTGANTYAGGTALRSGTLAVGSSGALGTGGLVMDDGTTLAFSANNLTIANPITMTGIVDPTFDTGANTATLTGGISGAADLTKIGTGTLILGAANNTYTGATTVAQGTLQAGVANAFAPASPTTVAAGATLATGGFNQTVGSLTNAGTVSLLGTTAGSTLTVNGNYVGNNGLLRVGTVLGDSSSVTDRLVVTGSASGTTTVQVTNLNGLGGQTTGNGISVVSAAGGIANGAFSLAAPVSAGAYDYQLNTAGGSAYLSSTTAPAPAPAPAPSPAPAPAPAPTPAPAPAPVVGLPTYRADVPLYAALPEQLRQSNLAMLGNMHQRIGDDGGTGSNTGSPDQGYRQAWGRVISIDRDIQQSGTVSPHSEGRLTGFQAGTDLWANANWRTGVYVGQLEGDMSVSGFARGVINYASGSNDLRSQYLGAYATWKNDSGLYVDGVLQAGRHRYTVNPALAFSSSGKGDSLLASVEVGQAFAIAPNWTIEPQLQLVHQRLSLDDTGIVGATVHQNTDGGWMARAGVRIKGEFQTGMGTLQPYARVNVYKRGSGTDVTSFIGPAASTPILTRTGGTSSEVALGATWQLSQSTSLYGEVGKLWASGGDAKTKGGVNGSLGVKVRW